MAKLDIKGILSAAVTAGVVAAATAPSNTLQPHDAGQVAAIVKESTAPVVQEMQSRIDYATNQESNVKSWSFNAAVIAVVSSGLTIYGALADGYLPEDNLIILGAAGTLISAGLWLIGRIRGKPIGE